jgi:ABC-type multidrug transport system ATPase subunit
MKKCLKCHTDNADENRFCQQCGRQLEDAVCAAGDATVLLSSTQVVRGPVQHSYSVARLFGSKERVVIGRAPDCDVCLAHPSVSRYHALLERRPDGLWLRDLASVNGVSVGGRRVTESTVVHDGEQVGVGPFLLSLTQGVLRSLDNARSLRLEAHALEKVVPLPGGGSRKLLDNVNLVVNPGEFVSLLGPSGSGKSTLMDCLNGRRRATGGKVLANGEDFYLHFDNFRQSLGYVPQRDIVHTQLSVYKALYYTARLRLPTDTGPEELQARIEAVLKLMELGPHRDTLVADLSGGQIKRVSLGAELLAEPCLLYIDEATSGLDAGTEARMMRLFRRLADEGRSIVCITHNVDNVDQGHLALVLVRGKVAYYGPPREAPRYFQVSRVSEVYDRLSQKGPEEWEKEFTACSLFREYVADRLAARPVPAPAAATPAGPVAAEPAVAGGPPGEGRGKEEDRPGVSRRLSELLADGRKLMAKWPPLADRFRRLTSRYLRVRDWLSPLQDQWHQFRVLTARYVELIGGDRRGLRLLLLQAPIVALFLLAGFVGKPYQQQVPNLRELTPEEGRLLVQIQGLKEALGEEGPGGQASGKARVRLQAPDLPLEIDGGPAAELLEKFDAPKLSARQRRELKKLPFKVRVAGLPVALDAAQAYDLLRSLQKKGLAPDRLEELKKAHLKVPAPGKPLELDASPALELLRQAKPAELPPDRRKALEGARFTVDVDGKEQTLTGGQLLWAAEHLRGSHLAEEILQVSGPVVPDGSRTNPRFTYIMLFIVVMIVLWFGCNNAAKEIVKEEAVYGRERAVNLGIVPYLASKFLVQTLITTFHALVLLGLLAGALELLHGYAPETFSVPPAQYMLGYPALFGVLVVLAMTGVALGLLLSACVATPDRANALLPYVLIPQIILGGGILSVEGGPLAYLAQGLSPVYWAFRAVHLGAGDLPPYFPMRVSYPDDLALPLEALLAQTVVLLALTGWFMRRKDAQ